ncbi:MAG: alanine dehydrogenase [Panacagrimonas sp.]
MRIGTPREIKVHEYRVGLTPAGVSELVAHGHEVFIETGAGAGSGFDDEDYRKRGAQILGSAAAVFDHAELILKVKEPQPQECARLRPQHTLFTYLHLAPDPVQAQGLLQSGCTAIAYETVRDAHGDLPLLAPMSEVAGRMAVQAGAHALEKAQGGAGVLLGGVPGVLPAQVLILGGGVVGTNAARIALGMGASVTVLDRSLARLRQLDAQFGGHVRTLYSTGEAIEQGTAQADLVIGAVLVPGASAPRLVTRAHLRQMRRGAVVVDVAIDQGGCFETSRPTTHDAPTYIEEGIVHYCVANMPGAVARTATIALTNATLPYVLALADQGVRGALLGDPLLCAGLNVRSGQLTHAAVAASLGLSFTPAEAMLRTS